MEIDLKNTYQLQWNKLNENERNIFETFPEDYQDFLKKNNGGTVENESKCFFKTELVRKFDDGRVYEGTSNGVEEFWGFLSYENEQSGKEFEYPMSILHQHFDRHLDEEFLPSHVMVIGRCIQNSLLAISLNKHNFGSIYYWEWYWQYPWFQDLFSN